MKRINDFTIRHASPELTVCSFLLAGCVVVLYGFVLVPNFQAATSGLRPFDFTYPLTANLMFEQLPYYTEASRQAYLRFSIADFVYPPLAALFITTLWAWLYSIAPNPPFWKLINYGVFALPFLTALFDWFENIGFLIVILSYPNELWGVARLAAFFKQLNLLANLINVGLTIMFVVTTFVFRSRRG